MLTIFLLLLTLSHQVMVNGHNASKVSSESPQNASSRNNQCVANQEKNRAVPYHHISLCLFLVLMIAALSVCLLQVMLEFRLRCYVPDSCAFVLIGLIVGFFVQLLTPGIPYAAPGADNYAPALFFLIIVCLLYTSPSPRDLSTSRMPSSA